MVNAGHVGGTRGSGIESSPGNMLGISVMRGVGGVCEMCMYFAWGGVGGEGVEAIKQSKNNNSQGPDKLNIRHLKHIGPLGLAFLTSMFKTALNKNIIPHTWKLANIVPIPKPNKDTNKGTSYRPISLLSVIAKTLEKSLLPYITANIPNTPMQHGYKTQHSTVTALHTLNNTVAKGFNQMAPLREQSL